MAELLLTILGYISQLVNLCICVVIAYVAMSWLAALNVVPRTLGVNTVVQLLYRITEPALRPIRKVLPKLGGLDISPIIMALILIFIKMRILPFIASLIA